MTMKYYYPLILVAVFLSSSCSNVIDCLINVRPELQHRQLEAGYADRYYFDKISAQIKNDPNDNSYDYYFSVSGEVPRGIDVIYDYRDVIFEGVPEETGRFRIRVSLDVDAYEYYDYQTDTYSDGLCTDYTSKVYTLVIR